MNKFFVLLFLSFLSVTARSQTAASYGFSAFTTTYTSIAGSGSTLVPSIICDDCTQVNIPIGFTFKFCGTNYTSLSATSNAYLSLTNSTAFTFINVAANIVSPGMLFAYWDDLEGFPTIPSTAYYRTSGTAPNRVFTFEWKDFGTWFGTSTCTSCPANIQIKLYETSNLIDFIYGPSTYVGRTASIGIANSVTDWQTLDNVSGSPTPSSTVFTDVLANSPANGQVYRWGSNCAGTPVTGAISALPASGCGSFTSVLSLPSSSIGTGLSYQWLTSPDSLTWTSIPGATGSTYAATISVSTYYRCIMTCAYGGVSGTSPSFLLVSNPLPAPISGASSFCPFAPVTLTDPTPGGVWTSSNVVAATVGSLTGVVSGGAPGVSIIRYTLPTGCAATKSVTVVPAPVTISGPPTVCTGVSVTLSDAMAGGTWSSSNPAVGTVGSVSGNVTGISTGTTTITYTLGGCSVYRTETVIASPAAITGPSEICLASSELYTDSTPGGTWTTSVISRAIVGSPSGTVTGVGVGPVVISYTIPGGCFALAAVTVDPLPSTITGTPSVCVGRSTTLFCPGGGTWSSTNPATATIGSSTGIVTGVSAGPVTIIYTLPTGCSATYGFTVLPPPAPITGSPVLCVGAVGALTDATPGGAWTSSNPAIASVHSLFGIDTGRAAGTATLYYTLGTGCYSTLTVTVNAPPAPITGVPCVIVGSSTMLSSTGGTTWSSGSSSVVSVGSSSGVVTGVAVGVDNITCYGSSGCYVTVPVTVNPVPAPIVGTHLLCAGLTTTLTDAAPGGTWTSSNPAVATIDASTGFVTATGAGVALIFYTLPGGCTGPPTTFTLTVNATPSAIAGGNSVCQGSNITLYDLTPGGTWTSSAPGIAPVSTTGMVNGIALGTAIITYSFGASCYATQPVTVNPMPGAISGPGTVCNGSSITMSCTGGGTWISTMTPVATVDSITGVVSGITTGNTTIIYSLPTTCSSSKSVTVSPVPSPITGPLSVCRGASTTLSDPTPGGTWSSSLLSVATIGSLSGIVAGVATGVATISYTLSTGCSARRTVSVTTAPGPITGSLRACVAQSTILGNSVPGGVWTSATTAVATAGSLTGIISGVVPGNSVITYSLGTGCIVTATVTVNPSPALITGASQVCVGSAITLTDASIGGTWSSSSTSTASVGSLTGLVNGITAGVANISYTVSSGCSSIKSVTVVALPAPISGTASVCVGGTTILNNISPGGTWASSAPAIATIGSLTGLVSGITAGVANITYRMASSCFITKAVTVNPSPPAITGSALLCVGNFSLLSDVSIGGLWSTSGTTIARVGSSSGLVTGVSAGTAFITYTATTGCVATREVTVSAPPAGITGSSTLCMGSSVVESNTTPGGTWASSNLIIATVGSLTGMVTGVNTGFAVISYTTLAGCIVTKIVTVNLPPPGISGPSRVCVGQTISLTDPVPGGIWASSSTAVAAVGSLTGVVSGIVGGVVTISYTVTEGCTATYPVSVNSVPPITGIVNLCAWGDTLTIHDATPGGLFSSTLVTVFNLGGGAARVTSSIPGSGIIMYTVPSGCTTTAPITVNPLPGPITGSYSICVGASTTLRDASPGGVWTSSAPGIISAGSFTGVVTGVAAGTAFVTYTLPTGCKLDTMVLVNNIPAGITGWGSTVMVGTSTTYADATPGGIWTSSNPAVASIGMSSGTVTGLAAGYVTISYTIGTGCSAFRALTVVVMPATRTASTISDNSDFLITPNPTSGRILLNGTFGDAVFKDEGDSKVYLSITDMLGRVVHNEILLAHYGKLQDEVTLNSQLANGMYLLSLRTDAGMMLFHLVLER